MIFILVNLDNYITCNIDFQFFFIFCRYLEDIQAYELKNNCLNNTRSKLETTLDDLEDELQMEKKAKGQLETQKRKVEGNE